MRIPRVYIEGKLSAQSEICLSQQATHYLLRVLRMSVGRKLICFDGNGGQYSAELVSADKKQSVIRTFEFEDINNESPLTTHLAIGISRGERFDWVLQKATELGVTAITPLFTARTEVKLAKERLTKKIEHWRQICISACEQCQRNILPRLDITMTFDQYVSEETAQYKFILHHEAQKGSLSSESPKSVALLIGPEGGLNPLEIEQSKVNGFQPLVLGPRVLRTETAPLIALGIAQSLWGDIQV